MQTKQHLPPSDSYVRGRALLVLSHAALQVEGEVVAADQHPLPELLLELPHVRLDPREIQLLWTEAMLLHSI